jgi:hypothetical protein
MSRENLEIVRRWLAATPKPPEELQAFVDEFWDEHGDYYPVRKFPEAVPCHGREEIARFLTGYTEAWSYRHTIKGLIPVGDDRVLAYAALRAEGYERGEDHLTPKGALRALGLRGDTLEAVGLRE